MKPLKKGITTGTCAQAAAKGASMMLFTENPVNWVSIESPSGTRLKIRLIDQEIGEGFARCGVVKFAGDDPDVTDGIKIYAEVRISSKRGVNLKGGEGIGKVTKPGLAVPVGEYAINPTPKKMIIKEASKFLPRDKGLEVTISAPDGKRLAERTFNPKLGITGGISILGTTGIVEPRSQDAYKASLSLQLNVLKASGYKRAILVLGYVGERFCRDSLRVKGDSPRTKTLVWGSMVKIGDHVGFMLRECAKKGIRDVLLIGHIGKLIKVANGQFNTHMRFGDNRIETIVRYVESEGADKRIIQAISREVTAEATIDILRQNKLTHIFNKIARDVVKKSEKFVYKKVRISCIMLSLKGEVLGRQLRGSEK